MQKWFSNRQTSRAFDLCKTNSSLSTLGFFNKLNEEYSSVMNENCGVKRNWVDFLVLPQLKMCSFW